MSLSRCCLFLNMDNSINACCWTCGIILPHIYTYHIVFLWMSIILHDGTPNVFWCSSGISALNIKENYGIPTEYQVLRVVIQYTTWSFSSCLLLHIYGTHITICTVQALCYIPYEPQMSVQLANKLSAKDISRTHENYVRCLREWISLNNIIHMTWNSNIVQGWHPIFNGPMYSYRKSNNCANFRINSNYSLPIAGCVNLVHLNMPYMNWTHCILQFKLSLILLLKLLYVRLWWIF